MDEELEKAIDGVGRDSVFARAARYGWRAGDAVPKWVWWGIVQELRADRAELSVAHNYVPNKSSALASYSVWGGLFGL